jgi:hypothetical protein
MPDVPARKARRALLRVAGVAAVLATTVGFGATAVANHVFPDVPSTYAFHAEVESVVDAGIATGYPNGTFKPNQAVTRGQFAAWTSRSATRVEQIGNNSLIAITANNSYQTVASTTIVPGAANSVGRIFGTVTATFSTTAPAACPCFAELSVQADNVGSGLDVVVIDTTIPNDSATDDSGRLRNAVTMPFMFDLADLGTAPAESPVDIRVTVRRQDANLANMAVNVTGWAATAPFDSDAYAGPG